MKSALFKSLKSRRVKPALVSSLAALAGIMLVWGCSGGHLASMRDPVAPPTGYQRRMVVVLERPGFYPAAGIEVRVEVEAPTRLVSPASGRGRTDGRGALELVFEPLPEYDRRVLSGGDVVAEFYVKAHLTIGGQRRTLEDRQTFARYADPLYQGLNRDPETKPTYHHLILGSKDK